MFDMLEQLGTRVRVVPGLEEEALYVASHDLGLIRDGLDEAARIRCARWLTTAALEARLRP